MKTKGKIICLGVGGTVILTGGIVSGYYIGENVTTQQIQKAKDEGIKEGYDQGLQEALENKILLEKTIAEYKSTCTTQKIELDGAKDQVKILQDNNKALTDQITAVTTSRDNWQQKANDYEIENNSLKAEKTTLQTTIASDKAEIERLKASGEDHTAEIARLENKVAQDETLLASYEATIQSNLASMVEVNGKIVELSNQIVTLTAQVNNNSSIVSSLNATIAKLEKSVAYYEQFIAQLENGDQVVATFKMDGSIWGLQIVKKGTSATPATPTSTDHVIFNYWMLNGEQVDPSTMILNTNTMFVANVTYKYDVTFMVDGQQHDETQLVVKDGKATVPTDPTKEGYTFEGWTLNGSTVVDPAIITVTEDTTFIAKFSQLCTVTFVSEEITLSTQSVKAGEFAEDVSVESTTHKVFNGWKVNGAFVDVTTYPITGAVTFVADYTYKYDVKFMDGETQLGETQLVIKNAIPTIPTAPTKEGYVFDGWTINGVTIVDPATNKISDNVTYSAKYTKVYDVAFVSEENVVSTQSVKAGEFAEDVSVESTTHKVFNGWKVNNEIVDVSEYAINEETTFVADYTYKYDVTFMVEGQQHGETQLVVKDGKATVPTDPTKEGYNFKGWSDGTTIVDLTTYSINSNVTFNAIFEAPTWNEIYTTETSVIGVNEIDVEGLNPDDLYQVTLTNLAFKIKPKTMLGGSQSWHLVEGDSGHSWYSTSIGKSYYDIMIPKGETVVFTYGSDENLVTITLSIDCNTDGKLIVNYSLSGGNVTNTYEISKLAVSKVEVFR